MSNPGVLFLLVATVCVSFSSQEVIKISLYYESLCPYCENFILTQLYPGYKVFREYIDLDLVPYGKAKRSTVDGKLQVTCQHGDKECAGNRIQGCALPYASSQKDQLNFVVCMSDSPADLELAQKCATANNIVWESLKACIDGPLGDTIVNRLGDITQNLSPPLTSVPHIIVNDTYDRIAESALRIDFMNLCSIFNDPPSVCPNI